MTHEIKYNCVIYNRSLLVVYFQCKFLTFLELRGIFSLKAVSVLNWKNVAEEPKRNKGASQQLVIFCEW